MHETTRAGQGEGACEKTKKITFRIPTLLLGILLSPGSCKNQKSDWKPKSEERTLTIAYSEHLALDSNQKKLKNLSRKIRVSATPPKWNAIEFDISRPLPEEFKIHYLKSGAIIADTSSGGQVLDLFKRETLPPGCYSYVIDNATKL